MKAEKKDLFNRLSPFVRICGEFELPPGFLREPYSINDHEYLYVLSGQGNYRVAGATHFLRPGDLLRIPPHVETQSWNDHAKPMRFFAVHFDFFYHPRYERLPIHQMRRTVPKAHPTAGIPDAIGLPEKLNGADDPRIALQLERIIAEVGLQPAGYPLAAKACLLELFSLLLRRIESHAVAGLPPNLEAVLRHVEAHFAREIKLGDLAGVAGLHEVYLERLFKKTFGATPMRYVSEFRVRKSKMLLMEPGRTIQEVARLVGFPDPYYYSRLFRRFEGISPRQYRCTASHPDGVRLPAAPRRKAKPCPLYQGYA
jgi:AraC-like DNA-binding protein